MDLKTSKIIIVDDHPLIRLGIKSFFSGVEGYQVIDDARNGEHSINKIKVINPDFVILDINMPLMSGFDVMRKFSNGRRKINFVLYTNFISEGEFNLAIKLGAKGILLKECNQKEILLCLDSIKEGKKYFGKDCGKISCNPVNQSKSGNFVSQKLDSLTINEKRILNLVARKKTTKQIAELLFKSPKTIENVRYQICRKIGISGHNSLTLFAVENREQLV